MKIIPFLKNDLLNISHLQPDDWQDIVAPFAFYTSTPYCFPVKITMDDRITGIGCAIKFPTSGWLAHIIVDPSFRNSGIGTSITRYLMEWLQKNNCNTLQLIATDAGEPIYRKLGFTAIMKYNFYNGSCSDPPDQHAIHPYHNRYKADIFRLDQYVSGDDRIELLHAHLPTMKLYLENQNILGFYAPHLGEGQILATDAVAGIELLRLKHYKTKIRTAIPEKNKEAVEFLSQPDFSLERNALRMVFGKTWKWHPEYIFSRIGGNLG